MNNNNPVPALFDYTVGFLSGFVCAFVVISYRLIRDWRERAKWRKDWRAACAAYKASDEFPHPDEEDDPWLKIYEDFMSDRGTDA